MFYCALSFLAGYASTNVLRKLDELADTIFTVPEQKGTQPALPFFDVLREDGNIKIILEDMHGAKNVKGLHVLYPSIENSELAASDAPLKVNQTFTIPDP